MNKKDLIKAIAVFSIIALCSGIVLGLVVQLTHISATERQMRAISVLESFYNSSNFEPVKDIELNENIQYFFYDEREDVYAIVANGVKGYKDTVTMYVIIKDDKIVALKAGDNKETPGISDSAFDDFLDRFLNIDVYELSGKFTDTVTGATYSKKAVRSSIKNAVDFYIDYKN